MEDWDMNEEGKLSGDLSQSALAIELTNQHKKK